MREITISSVSKGGKSLELVEIVPASLECFAGTGKRGIFLFDARAPSLTMLRQVSKPQLAQSCPGAVKRGTFFDFELLDPVWRLYYY